MVPSWTRRWSREGCRNEREAKSSPPLEEAEQAEIKDKKQKNYQKNSICEMDRIFSLISLIKKLLGVFDGHIEYGIGVWNWSP